MYAITSINPFLAARFKRLAAAPRPQRRPEPEQPVYARLPQAPKNASPVPHLLTTARLKTISDPIRA